MSWRVVYETIFVIYNPYLSVYLLIYKWWGILLRKNLFFSGFVLVENSEVHRSFVKWIHRNDSKFFTIIYDEFHIWVHTICKLLNWHTNVWEVVTVNYCLYLRKFTYYWPTYNLSVIKILKLHYDYQSLQFEYDLRLLVIGTFALLLEWNLLIHYGYSLKIENLLYTLIDYWKFITFEIEITNKHWLPFTRS